MLKFNNKISNKIELISIHIPKTAGTSFRNILKDTYGEDSVVRFDLVHKGKAIFVENKELSSKKLPSHIKIIHGHFYYSDLVEKLKIKKDIPVIVWLRNPVERVISNYNYFSKRLSEELDEKGKGLDILARMQKSLSEFARLEVNRNLISKFLDGILLEEMKFVGIQEYFDDDLEYFADLFGIDNIQALEQNITGKKYQVSNDTYQEIAALNELDMKLYKQALGLRQKRLEILH